MEFAQHIINGLLSGCILALIGLGFSLVWGILNIINLAHSAFIMLAAFFTYYLWAGLGVDPFITLPLTVVTLFGAGYLLQRYVINLVMGASILTTFLLTFGLESLLVTLALRLFSADTRQSRPFYANASLNLGPLYIPYTQLGAVAGALLGGLVFGLVYEFGGTYVLSQRDVVIFAILILVLVLRPTGLLGREGYR